jgi:hypothetical protein
MFLKYLDALLMESKIDDRLAASKLSSEDKAKVKEMNAQLTNKSKYVDFLIKNKDEDDIVEIINTFEKNVNKLEKKDILQYSLEDLREIVKSGGVKSKTDVKKETLKDAEKIYEDENLLVICPKTYEASCLYGKGTKWCIASDSTSTHWHSYISSRMKFYFAFNKKLTKEDPLYKVAVAVYPDGKKDYYDAEDRKLSSKPDFL